MKQNAVYLLKGLLFSTLFMSLATLLLALVMFKTQWGDSVMFPLMIIFFCLSAFVGGLYFAKHTSARRFLWGIGFGAAFFAVYLTVTYFLSTDNSLFSDNSLLYLAVSLGGGCLGGMLS